EDSPARNRALNDHRVAKPRQRDITRVARSARHLECSVRAVDRTADAAGVAFDHALPPAASRSARLTVWRASSTLKPLWRSGCAPCTAASPAPAGTAWSS